MFVYNMPPFAFEAEFDGDGFVVKGITPEAIEGEDAARNYLNYVYGTLTGSKYMPSAEWVEYEVASAVGQKAKQPEDEYEAGIDY